MAEHSQHPDLEERFQQPLGWRWHHLKRGGRKMRFGSVFPKDSIPSAVVVCLPGLSEYAEKYFEIAREMLSHNYAFWVLDWMGQGLSDRYLPNRHKRHSIGFQQDVDDLHDFILGYIKHSSVHPDVGRIPMAMLAHSMGANLGLHYMHQHPDVFECAALSAPMIGIASLNKLPGFAQKTITGTAAALMKDSFAPGAAEWSPEPRSKPGHDEFSKDPARGAIHNSWLQFNPDLQIGHVTYGWVNEAVKSCVQVQKPSFLKSIQAYCLLAVAGEDSLVDNNAITKAASLMPNAHLINLPESKHEILMEKDEIRGQFLSAFHRMIKESIIERPETLKPF